VFNALFTLGLAIGIILAVLIIIRILAHHADKALEDAYKDLRLTEEDKDDDN
jgi:hypothetical protein